MMESWWGCLLLRVVTSWGWRKKTKHIEKRGKNNFRHIVFYVLVAAWCYVLRVGVILDTIIPTLLRVFGFTRRIS